MAKELIQFRYFNESSAENFPRGNMNKSNLIDGSVFDQFLPFVQIGIQTLPGTRVYLNDSIEHPIIIGSTGTYQLDLDDISEITKLRFDARSVNLIEGNAGAYLIIDVISNRATEG